MRLSKGTKHTLLPGQVGAGEHVHDRLCVQCEMQ